MSVESILSSAIEAAVGIGGFAGIIAAIRQRGVAHWPLEERLLLQMLLTASAATVVFSLLPWLLDEIGIPQSIGWRMCSGTLFVWLVAIGMRRRRQAQKFTRPAALPALVYAWMIVSLALQAINLHLGEAWPFMLGVLGLLANGFTFFLLLLFWEGGDDEKSA